MEPQKRMGKLRASYLLATESFELFRKDPEIVWFVLWEALIILALLAVAFGGFTWFIMSDTVAFPEEGEASATLQVAGYAVLFLSYLVGAYVTTYFGVALTSVVAARIEGEDKGVRDGIQAANERAGKIFVWALISSTVGLILQIIADKASWVGKLVSWLGGVAWGVATFFIVPVLARENDSVPNSIKRSGQTFVSTWGETIVMNFSLGLFFGAIYLLLIVLFFVLLAAFSMLGSTEAFLPSFVLLVVSFGILLVVVALIQSVLQKVFKVVLYEYAVRGTIPESFTPELIMGAMKRKDGTAVSAPNV